MPPIKDVLTAKGTLQFEMPGLHNVIKDQNGKGLAHIFKFNYLSAAGTAILIAALISTQLVGLTFRTCISVFGQTLFQLRFPILTIAAVLAFAYLVNDSGITLTIAKGLANTGVLFPFFAPVLGWLGVRAYGLYLTHTLMMVWTGNNIIGVGASLVVSAIAWRYLEEPLIRFGKKPFDLFARPAGLAS